MIVCLVVLFFFSKEGTNRERMIPLKSWILLKKNYPYKTKELNSNIYLHIPYINGNH